MSLLLMKLITDCENPLVVVLHTNEPRFIYLSFILQNVNFIIHFSLSPPPKPKDSAVFFLVNWILEDSCILYLLKVRGKGMILF